MADIVELLTDFKTRDHERGCLGREYVCSCGYDNDIERSAIEARDEILSLRSRLEQAERERDELRSENGRLIDENCDLRNEPWPEWAGAVLKVIRLRSGYDGYDDTTDGVDLPAELNDCFSELEREAEEAKARAEAAEASLAKAVEVIRPFGQSDLVDLADLRALEDNHCLGGYSTDFTIGHLRKAAEFIKEIEG